MTCGREEDLNSHPFVGGCLRSAKSGCGPSAAFPPPSPTPPPHSLISFHPSVTSLSFTFLLSCSSFDVRGWGQGRGLCVKEAGLPSAAKFQAILHTSFFPLYSLSLALVIIFFPSIWEKLIRFCAYLKHADVQPTKRNERIRGNGWLDEKWKRGRMTSSWLSHFLPVFFIYKQKTRAATNAANQPSRRK